MGSIGAREMLEEGPRCPPEAMHLWEWFRDLSFRRLPGGFGPSPITFGEIAAWQSLRRIRLDSWELDALLELDTLFLELVTPPAKPAPGSSVPPPPAPKSRSRGRRAAQGASA